LLDQLDHFWNHVMSLPLIHFLENTEHIFSNKAVECLQSVSDAIDYTKSVLNTQYEHDSGLKDRLIKFTNDIDGLRKITYGQAFGQEIHE